jgi:hypothetical protein
MYVHRGAALAAIRVGGRLREQVTESAAEVRPAAGCLLASPGQVHTIVHEQAYGTQAIRERPAQVANRLGRVEAAIRGLAHGHAHCLRHPQ